MPFSKAENIGMAEIHGKIVETRGVGAIDERNVRKWCQYFKDGRVNIRDDERSGRPCLVQNDLKGNLNTKNLKKEAIRNLLNCMNFCVAGHSLRSDQGQKTLCRTG
jgi:hypothetical protein